MNVRELSDKCAEIVLEDEEEGIQLFPDRAPVEEGTATANVWTLVGRFLTEKPIKFDAMQHVMASVWWPLLGVQVTAAQPNLFLFTFFHESDMRRVLVDGPWSFENSTLVCRQITTGQLPTDVALDAVDIWIQVYDLPFGYSTDLVLERIGNFVGAFVSLDETNYGSSWKHFYRVRVALDVKKPLKRRMKLIKRDGTWVWINFKYERLHAFCFFCGLLGHTDKFCLKAREAEVAPGEYPYGSWMRAGAGRGVRGVGDKWLVPSRAAGIQEYPAQNPSRVGVGWRGRGQEGDSEGTEVCEGRGLEAEPKRRRGEGFGCDVIMTDRQGNLLAGPGSQACPPQ